MARRVEAVVCKEHKSFSVKENGEIISVTVCQEKQKYHSQRKKVCKVLSEFWSEIIEPKQWICTVERNRSGRTPKLS